MVKKNMNFFQIYVYSDNIIRGKAISLQAWIGPEGSRRLRLPDFETIDTCRVVRLSILRTGHL